MMDGVDASHYKSIRLSIFIHRGVIILNNVPVLPEEFAIRKVRRTSLFQFLGVIIEVRLQCSRTKGCLSLLAPCP